MSLIKGVVSKKSILDMVIKHSRVSFHYKGENVYAYSKEELEFLISEILVICDTHSYPNPLGDDTK